MMEDVEYLENFITTITKIVEITCLAEEAFKENKKRSRVKLVNLARARKRFAELRKVPLQQNDEEHFSLSRAQERLSGSIGRVQLQQNEEEVLIKPTRMSEESFELLLSLLRERLRRFSNRGAIKPEKRLSLTLMYLEQGCNVQVLSREFNLAISTVRKVLYETCDDIWQEFHEKYLKPPSKSEFKEISEQFFLKTGIPHCLGAIDSKNVRITCPRNFDSYEYNHGKKHSVVLLAACDANYAFTYVDVVPSGNQNDGGVLARSDYGKQLINESLEVPYDEHLAGCTKTFPFYFVGSSGFPLKRNLMRPFPGNNLSDDKEKFNAMLFKARLYIENSFGLLANRWRVLHTTINASPKNANKIILATVLLHNFLMQQNDKTYFTMELVDHRVNDVDVEGQWRSETGPLPTYQRAGYNRSSTHAFELREELKEYFQSNWK